MTVAYGTVAPSASRQRSQHSNTRSMMASEAVRCFHRSRTRKEELFPSPKSKRKTAGSSLEEAPKIKLLAIARRAAEREKVYSSCNFFYTREKLCSKRLMCFELYTNSFC